MPTKLKVVLVLLSLSALVNLATGHWFSAVIGIALIFGVAKGSDGTRSLVIGVAGLNLASVAMMLFGFHGGYGGWSDAEIIELTVIGLVALPPVFTIWCLLQADVIDWMYKHSLPAAVRDL